VGGGGGARGGRGGRGQPKRQRAAHPRVQHNGARGR
jgi:hypothetical protein